MQPEHFRDGTEGLEPESGTYPRFWTTSDKELDFRNFVDIAREHGKDGRCGLLVLALIKGVDDDEDGDLGCFERANYDFLQLGTKSLSCDIRTSLQNSEQLLSERRVSIRELKRERWEDRLKVTPVLEISRTKETRAKFPIRKAELGKCLGNGRLAGSSEPVQPEDTLISLVH